MRSGDGSIRLFDVSARSACSHIYSGCAGTSTISRFPALLVVLTRGGFVCVRGRSLICRALRYGSAAKAKDVPLARRLIIRMVALRLVVIHVVCPPEAHGASRVPLDPTLPGSVRRDSMRPSDVFGLARDRMSVPAWRIPDPGFRIPELSATLGVKVFNAAPTERACAKGDHHAVVVLARVDHASRRARNCGVHRAACRRSNAAGTRAASHSADADQDGSCAGDRDCASPSHADDNAGECRRTNDPGARGEAVA